MSAVFKHEVRNYFHSMTTYIFCGVMLLFVGIGSMLYNIQSSVANFEYVLNFISVGMAIIVPVLTMRIISEEKKQKTDQLLYSLPLKTSEVILGKYFAMLLVFLLPMVIISFYPLIFSHFGDVCLPTSYGSLFAFFVMCAAMIAFGTFISSLTENQGLAAGVSIAILMFNYFSVKLANYVSLSSVASMIVLIIFAVLIALVVRHVTKNTNLGYIVGIALIVALGVTYFANNSAFENLLPNLMTSLSLFNRFADFVNGVFDVTNIVFYVTVIIFFLFLSVQALEKRRYN